MNSDKENDQDPSKHTRREAIIGTTGVLVSLNFPQAVFGQAGGRTEESQTLQLLLVVNGASRSLTVDVRSSLLDVLRETLGLTGAKKGCDHGQCGACTVHVEGRRVVSCLTLAAQIQNTAVTTIEGLAGPEGTLHPMQQAFIDHDALQCGYCTPGQIMSAIACVREGNARTASSIREYMSGNLCRCGAYIGIVAAIQDAAAKMSQGNA